MYKLIITIFLTLLVGCSYGGEIDTLSINDGVLGIAIYPTGGLDETYFFVLTENNELISIKGTRSSNEISSSTFISKEIKNKKKAIEEEEFEKLLKLATNIYETNDKSSEQIVLDSWIVEVFYKEKKYKHYYYIDITESVKLLVDEVINISPIEVDLHGWS